MNLFTLNDKELIEKTSLSRKLTLGGVTKAYPVYKIRLDLLYYNDQNDTAVYCRQQPICHRKNKE